MKKTINIYQFRQAFQDYNRQDNFSYEGLEALFNFFEELEESTDNEIELDVIAICCDFTEYQNLQEFQEYCGEEYKSIEDIEYHTIVIPIDNESFITQNF